MSRTPGLTSQYNSHEASLFWGGMKELRLNGTIVSTAVDAGNTPTTTLRKGLILGKVSATGKYKEHDPDGTDGSQIAVGVLGETINMLDEFGTARDMTPQGGIIVGGCVRASSLVNISYAARADLTQNGRFLFDDDLVGKFTGRCYTTEQNTGDLTLVAADSGKRIVCTTADSDITLPAIQVGLYFEFLRASDHEIAVISAEGDNMIVGNDLSADKVTFTTAGEQIGIAGSVRGIYVGTTPKWLFQYINPALGTGVTGGVTLAITT